jgi:hypothetical protein
MEQFTILILAFLLMVLVFIALTRWIFRINDIVKRLDKIIDSLKTT